MAKTQFGRQCHIITLHQNSKIKFKVKLCIIFFPWLTANWMSKCVGRNSEDLTTLLNFPVIIWIIKKLLVNSRILKKIPQVKTFFSFASLWPSIPPNSVQMCEECLNKIGTKDKLNQWHIVARGANYANKQEEWGSSRTVMDSWHLLPDFFKLAHL